MWYGAAVPFHPPGLVNVKLGAVAVNGAELGADRVPVTVTC